MNKKFSQVFYIVFLVPFLVNGVFPFFQYLWVKKSTPYIFPKPYYFSEMLIITASILLFVFLTFYIKKQDHINSLYFMIGIVVNIIVTILLKSLIAIPILNGYITLCISIVIYLFFIVKIVKNKQHLIK